MTLKTTGEDLLMTHDDDTGNPCDDIDLVTCLEIYYEIGML